jgi:hypothetical protein
LLPLLELLRPLPLLLSEFRRQYGMALGDNARYLIRREQRLQLVPQCGGQLVSEAGLVLLCRALDVRHLLVGQQRGLELRIVQVHSVGKQLLAGARCRLAQGCQRP